MRPRAVAEGSSNVLDNADDDVMCGVCMMATVGTLGTCQDVLSGELPITRLADAPESNVRRVTRVEGELHAQAQGDDVVGLYIYIYNLHDRTQPEDDIKSASGCHAMPYAMAYAIACLAYMLGIRALASWQTKRSFNEAMTGSKYVHVYLIEFVLTTVIMAPGARRTQARSPPG